MYVKWRVCRAAHPALSNPPVARGALRDFREQLGVNGRMRPLRKMRQAVPRRGHRPSLAQAPLNQTHPAFRKPPEPPLSHKWFSLLNHPPPCSVSVKIPKVSP